MTELQRMGFVFGFFSASEAKRWETLTPAQKAEYVGSKRGAIAATGLTSQQMREGLQPTIDFLRDFAALMETIYQRGKHE